MSSARVDCGVSDPCAVVPQGADGGAVAGQWSACRAPCAVWGPVPGCRARARWWGWHGCGAGGIRSTATAAGVFVRRPPSRVPRPPLIESAHVRGRGPFALGGGGARRFRDARGMPMRRARGSAPGRAVWRQPDQRRSNENVVGGVLRHDPDRRGSSVVPGVGRGSGSGELAGALCGYDAANGGHYEGCRSTGSPRRLWAMACRRIVDPAQPGLTLWDQAARLEALGSELSDRKHMA